MFFGNNLLLVNTFVSEPKMPCGLKHFLTHQQLRIAKSMFKEEIKFNSFCYVWMGTYIIFVKLQWYSLNWQQVWPHFLQFPIMNELVNSLAPSGFRHFNGVWLLSNLQLGGILINFICFYYEIFDYFMQSLIWEESSGKSYHWNSLLGWSDANLSHPALMRVGGRVLERYCESWTSYGTIKMNDVQVWLWLDPKWNSLFIVGRGIVSFRCTGCVSHLHVAISQAILHYFEGNSIYFCMELVLGRWCKPRMAFCSFILDLYPMW